MQINGTHRGLKKPGIVHSPVNLLRSGIWEWTLCDFVEVFPEAGMNVSSSHFLQKRWGML